MVEQNNCLVPESDAPGGEAKSRRRFLIDTGRNLIGAAALAVAPGCNRFPWQDDPDNRERPNFESLSEGAARDLCTEKLLVRKVTKRGKVRFKAPNGDKIPKGAVKAVTVMGLDFWRYRDEGGYYVAETPEALEKNDELKFSRRIQLTVKPTENGGFNPDGDVNFAGYRLGKKDYKREFIHVNGQNFLRITIKGQYFTCPVAFEDWDSEGQKLSLIYNYEVPKVEQEKSEKVQAYEKQLEDVRHFEVPHTAPLFLEKNTTALTEDSVVMLKNFIAQYIGLNADQLLISSENKPTEGVKPVYFCKTKILDVSSSVKTVAEIQWHGGERYVSDDIVLLLNSGTTITRPEIIKFMANNRPSKTTTSDDVRSYSFVKQEREFSDANNGYVWSMEVTDSGRVEVLRIFSKDTDNWSAVTVTAEYDRAGKLVELLEQGHQSDQEVLYSNK